MKLLIVDDEFFVKERIRKQINWNSLGISELKEASDGCEALNYFDQFTPDILLTDVRMSHMDGLLLAEETVKRNPACKVIFISGYPDKHDLKKAISLQAVSYVEKPIDMQELFAALENAVSAINQNNHIKKALQTLNRQQCTKKMQDVSMKLIKNETRTEAVDLLKDIVNLSEHDQFVNLIIQFLGDKIPPLHDEFVLNIVSTFKKDKINCICSLPILEKKQIIVHIFGENNSLRAYGYIERCCRALNHSFSLLGFDAVYSVGCFVSSPDDLTKSYEDAAFTMRQCFYKNPGTVRYYREYNLNSYRFENFNFSEFSHTLKKENSQSAIFFVRSLIADIRHYDNTDPSEVIRFFFSLLQILLKEAKKEDIILFEEFPAEHDIWSRINQFIFIDDLSAFVIDAIESYFSQIQKETTDNAVVNRIIRFVKKHYADPNLSITIISEHMHLSPTYICHLFKDITGGTLGNFLTEIRIRKAQEYINDPNYRIKDIAKLVGYRNGNYFSYQYKKHVGRSPSEQNES